MPGHKKQWIEMNHLYPVGEERMNTMSFAHIIEFHSVIRNNVDYSHITRMINLENIVYESSNIQKNTNSFVCYMKCTKPGNP